jgi:hypothetical protein
MMDQITATKLAALRRHIDATGALAGDTLKAVRPNARALEATPFLSACADELETSPGFAVRPLAMRAQLRAEVNELLFRRWRSIGFAWQSERRWLVQSPPHLPSSPDLIG